jgi:hypothetical protein
LAIGSKILLNSPQVAHLMHRNSKIEVPARSCEAPLPSYGPPSFLPASGLHPCPAPKRRVGHQCHEPPEQAER